MPGSPLQPTMPRQIVLKLAVATSLRRATPGYGGMTPPSGNRPRQASMTTKGIPA